MNPQDHRGGGRGGRGGRGHGGPRRPNQQGDYFPGNGADNRQGYRGDRDQGDRDGRYQGQGGHQGRGGHQGDYFAGNGARDHQGHRGGGGGHRGGHGNDRGGRGGGDRAPQGFRGGDRRRDEHHGHGHSQGHGGYRGGQGGRGHGGANRGEYGRGQGHGYGQGHGGSQGPPVSLSEHDVKFSLQQMLNLLDRGAVEEASSELTKRNTKARVAHALSNAATIAVDTRQALWKLVAHPRLARDRDAPLEQQQRLATFLADALGSPLLSKACVLLSLQVEGHGPSVAALVTRAAEHNTPEVLHKVKSDDLKFVIEKITEARIQMSEGLLADMRRVAAGNPTPAPVRREHVNAARDRQLEADLAEAVTFRTEQTVPAVGTFAPPPYGTVTTNGPLRSLPHHLDALYYLRRADALLPLYESVQKISTHRRGGPPPDRDCARFYEVTVAGAAISPVHGTLAELQFEAQRSAAPKPKHGKKNAGGGGGGISWERTKRLQSGSLVVLIGDDVGATPVAFGYIVDVEKDAAKEVMRRYDGLVAVRLRPEPMLLLQGEWRGRRLTLVDAETLWDGFAHVLEALRDIEASDFDPVLRCDLGADNALPRVADARPRLEMHPRAMDAYDRAAFQFHDGHDEPRDVAAPEQQRRDAFAAEKNFDATQRAGWEHLLDSRIGIVQGPPGTGKSYVGVAMIQYLLQHTNEKILLLCYTNHALDSCVADILEAVGSTALAPGRLVRLGGRSKLEGMQEYTLRALQSTRVRAGEWGRLLDNFREGLERWGDSEVLPSTLEYDPALSRQAKALWRNGALPKLLKELEDLMAEKRAVHRAAKSRVQSAHANKENARTRYANAVDAREPVSQGVIDALEAEVVKATEKEAECVALEKAAFLDVKFFLTRWAGSHRNAAAAALPDVSVDALLRGGADDGEAVGRAEAQDEVPLPPCVANPHRFEGQAKLTQPQRQAVHAYVRSEWQRGLMGELRRVGAAFERAHVQRQAEMQQADLSILRSARIIAATTSGAARNIAQLRQANRSTIVVEEAAEIAESDVLACIVPSARRLCQLGDHQQLRPKVNEFKLERHGANVSLMERLIRNDAVDFKTLGTQRRMRPAIADYTRWMYDSRVEGGIQDHPCVTADGARPDVAGLRGNVFFVDHSAPESTDNATRSHTNDQEAVFIWRLVAYLVMNRLKVERVVVVTTYLGQDMLLSRQRPQELKGVRVTTVDNYQGEENDVVIISLVRSDAPGFVRNANRVCVLLSRARCGMIVLGNLTKVFAALTGKNDVFDAADDNGDGAEPTFVWPRVLDVAKVQGALVDALPLKCREHGNETSVPVVGGRFPALGGCGQNCGARRKCGHACDFQCHGAPCETFSCKKPCARKCAAGLHECKAECGQQCPPCTVPVKRAIGCEGRHTMPVPCHETRVDQMCTQRIKCDLPCKHEGKRRCLPVGAPLSFLGCESRCGGELLCGHECERKCPACRRDGPSGPVRHKSCTHKCDRALPCGHSCKANCSDVCPPCEQPCVDACEHSACRHKCGEPCIQCVEPCTVGCEHRQCTKRCGEACDVKPCEEPCPKKLKCGAPCPGLCGEACPELACACPKCDKRKDVVELLGIEMDDDVRFVVACAAGHPVCVEAMDQLLKVWRKDRHAGQLKPPTCPVCKGFITARRYKADLAVAAADLTIIKQRMADELERAIATAAEAKATLLSCTSEATKERLPKPADKWKRKADSLLQDFDKSKAGRNIRLCVRFTWKAARMSTVWRLLLRPAMGHDDVMAAVRAPLENLLTFHERDHDDPKTAHAAATTAVLVAGLTAIDRGVAARLPPPPSPVTETAVAKYSTAVEKALANASVGLSEEELASIHRVLAAAGQIRERGAWHRHSCGYMYVIGDCGGAVMTGNCPQCGGALGGTGHMRAAGNDVVGVADGATQRDRDRWGHGLVHGMMMGN